MSKFQSRRFPRERIQKLGPGSHNPQPVENRVDFNRAGVGSNFQKPIAVKSDDPTKCQSFPAPNTYNLSDVCTGRNNLVAAEAAFKSKTKRDVISLQTADNPAPCQYTIQDQLMHHSAPPHKSVFDSKTPRGDFAKPVKVLDWDSNTHNLPNTQQCSHSIWFKGSSLALAHMCKE